MEDGASLEASLETSAPPGLALKKRAQKPRAEAFEDARERLSRLERANIKFIQWTFQNRRVDALLGWLMRHVGAGWVDICTRNLRRVRGLDQLGDLGQMRSYILVSNHRSFFDLFVVQMLLYRGGFRGRLLFPVRSNFFYDHPLGFLVNGVTSFFSMYPPIFRDRKRLSLNHAAFNELSEALKDGRSAGIHPEGTRNRGVDPYDLLPGQPGVGRAIHRSRLPVIPVFVNGLSNRFIPQLVGNFSKKGAPILVVFGAPIDFHDLLETEGSAKVYRSVADRVMKEIAELGRAERALRAEIEGDGPRTVLSAEGS